MNTNTKKNAVIHSALLIALSLAGTQAVHAGPKAPEIPAGWEPCGGVAKAGMNDCAARLHSCAGLSKTDNEADSYVYMPKGLCEKMAKGTVLSKEDVKKMMEMHKKM
jgi:uncharacterized membrane protein